MGAEPETSARHSALEDAQAVFCGALMAAVGTFALQAGGLATGQIAGLALVISYATDASVGPIFFLLNLPFYWFGFRRLGLAFTLKTFAAVALFSGLMAIAPSIVRIESIHPLAAALLGGVATAMGLLALFRHRASLGGVGVLALYLQDATGLKAGWTQMAVDAAVFAAALLVIDVDAWLYSLLGAIVLNLVIGVNHRRDRYIAT